MQKSWKICQFCRFFQFFSHLLFPQHLGTHFFGFLTIFYMDIGLFYWIFIMKIACIKTNMSKKRSKRATTLAEVKKSIFFKKRPKSDLVFTWYSLFEVSRVTWWWKWWRFLTFDPTAILAYCDRRTDTVTCRAACTRLITHYSLRKKGKKEKKKTSFIARTINSLFFSFVPQPWILLHW